MQPIAFVFEPVVDTYVHLAEFYVPLSAPSYMLSESVWCNSTVVLGLCCRLSLYLLRCPSSSAGTWTAECRGFESYRGHPLFPRIFSLYFTLTSSLTHTTDAVHLQLIPGDKEGRKDNVSLTFVLIIY